MTRKFGRIPEKTVALLEHSVKNVREKVVAAIPANADDDLRAFTTEKVLETIFRDWTENGNSGQLSDQDFDDFASFVQMSAALAGKQLTEQNRPVYESSLCALLEDWLYHWNADGVNGPPGPGARTGIRLQHAH